MLFRFYFIIIVCLGGLPLLSKVQPLSHEEIVGFRADQSAAIGAEKLICGTVYDAVAILSLANKWKALSARPDARSEYTDQFLSRLVQGVCLGYGFKNGVQSSLKPSATDRTIFQTSLENAGEQLLVTSDLPTGAAVWSDTSENHSAHAAQMAKWLKVRRGRGGALDMEYQVPPARYPDAALVASVPYLGLTTSFEELGKPIQIELEVQGAFSGQRLSNVPINNVLYGLDLPEACSCWPYNPTGDRGEFVIAQHPIVIEYSLDLVKGYIPVGIISKISEIKETRVYLNVQTCPWEKSGVLLRPHALSWLFPYGTQAKDIASEAQSEVAYRRYEPLLVYTVDDISRELLPSNKVHISIHPKLLIGDQYNIIASPPNMDLRYKSEAFFSLVIYGGKAVITRHIFLTPDQCDKLQQVFAPKAKTYKANEFIELLTLGWRDFLVRMGILPPLV